eukprot:59198-Pleurochrysis_carterae.AAC.1
MSSHAKMKGPPQVQILAHRDRRQLCLVDAKEPTNILSTVNCTTERQNPQDTVSSVGRTDAGHPRVHGAMLDR